MIVKAIWRLRHDIAKGIHKGLTDELLPWCRVRILIPAIALRASVGDNDSRMAKPVRNRADLLSESSRIDRAHGGVMACNPVVLVIGDKDGQM